MNKGDKSSSAAQSVLRDAQTIRVDILRVEKIYHGSN